MDTFKITIKGIVQGVGFRPFIYKIAKQLKLVGEVYNNSNGVTIKLNCTLKQVKEFIRKIKKEKPPLSQIDFIDYDKISSQKFDNFSTVKTCW